MHDLKKVQIIVFKNPPNPFFLLLKTARKKPMWQGVTGGVEDSDPSLIDAALRELQEELSFIPSEKKLIGPLHTFSFLTNRKGYEGTMAQEYCFGYELPANVDIKLSQEHSEYLWLSLDKAKQQIDFNEPKVVIQKIYDYLQHKRHS